MTCRTCGMEIADKALVCYRCGAATAEPGRRPARIDRPRGDRIAAVIALVLLLTAGLYLGQAAAGEETSQVIGWILLGGGTGLLGWRWVRRRRRR